MRVPVHLRDALVRLDVWARFVQLAQAAAGFEDAQAGLEQVKRDAERNFKRLALDAHPDRGGDEERMKELNAAMDLVSQLRVERPAPQPVTVIHVQFVGGFYSSTTTTSTGGWW